MPTVQRTHVPLAAMFLSWYGFDGAGNCDGKLGSYHWNSGPNLGGVVDTPIIGYYCSQNPDVVAWQLDQLEKAGVEALFVSWWGWGDSRLDGAKTRVPDTYINRGIAALLEGIAARKSPMKVSIIVEPFTLTHAGLHPDDLSAEQKRTVLDWLWSNYYGRADYRDLLFSWEGKPLLIAFDPMRLPADSRYTIRHWTGRQRNEETVGAGWQWFFGPPQDVIVGMSDDGVAFVYPRFDESHIEEQGADYITWPPRRIDPELREGIYERQWRQLAGYRGSLRMIVIYGWNHYGEQAHIEPSIGGPGRPSIGDTYVRKTRDYYSALFDE